MNGETTWKLELKVDCVYCQMLKVIYSCQILRVIYSIIDHIFFDCALHSRVLCVVIIMRRQIVVQTKCNLSIF